MNTRKGFEFSALVGQTLRLLGPLCDPTLKGWQSREGDPWERNSVAEPTYRETLAGVWRRRFWTVGVEGRDIDATGALRETGLPLEELTEALATAVNSRLPAGFAVVPWYGDCLSLVQIESTEEPLDDEPLPIDGFGVAPGEELANRFANAAQPDARLGILTREELDALTR